MPQNDAKARENWDAYVYARDNGHIEYVQKADKCDNYFAGLQWDENVRRSLERLGKPVLTINETFATLVTIMGEQIAARSDISFRPSRGGIMETAEALDKVWMHINSSQKYDWKESQVADDGFITSRGFFDVRISFDDHMKGEVSIETLNPRNVIVDPDGEKYDPDTWKEVFITKWLTPSDIEAQYNKADADILAKRDDTMFAFGYDSADGMNARFGGYPRIDTYDRKNGARRNIRILERQYKQMRRREFFVDLRTGDMRPVPDTWDFNRISAARENLGLAVIDKRAEQIRWRVTADNVVLHDEWSPYQFYTVVPFFPFFRRGRTIGLVENLISPQDVLNKSESQELHVINTTANSGWKIKTGSVQNMEPDELEQRGAETGLVLELDDINNAEKIQPNQIPSGLDRVSFKAKEHLKSISNVSESQRGMDRADVAAKAIEAKRAAGGTSLIKPLDNLNETRSMVAMRVLNLVQTYYTEERVLQITGRGPGDKTEELVVNQMTPEGEVINDLTLGEYSVVVTTVPSRDGEMETQFDNVVRLRELGVQIPDEVLIENSRVIRKSELIKDVREANGKGDPSEAQRQIAEMEVQLKQLEVQEKQISNDLKAADAEFTRARAVKTQAETTAEGGVDQLAELEIHLKDQREREQLQNKLALEREKMEQELAIKREQLHGELALKRAEAAERIDQQAAQAEEQKREQKKPASAK